LHKINRIFLQFASTEDAADTREQIYGVIWPPHNTSKPLLAEFVADEVVAKLGPSQRLRSSDPKALNSSGDRLKPKEAEAKPVPKKEPGKPIKIA